MRLLPTHPLNACVLLYSVLFHQLMTFTKQTDIRAAYRIDCYSPSPWLRKLRHRSSPSRGDVSCGGSTIHRFRRQWVAHYSQISPSCTRCRLKSAAQMSLTKLKHPWLNHQVSGNMVHLDVRCPGEQYPPAFPGIPYF